MSEKFDIYSKIFFRDVANFVRHLCVLVLRHQMRVSNYFVNSFYSELSKVALGTFNGLSQDGVWEQFAKFAENLQTSPFYKDLANVTEQYIYYIYLDVPCG